MKQYFIIKSMEYKHIDYFLRRIKDSDSNISFITEEEGFNTPSKTLKEFISQDMDCNENGVFITYVFGKEKIVYGIARMKPLAYEDFKTEMIDSNSFVLEELLKYEGCQIIYISRAGVAKEKDGLGWGTMLRSFLDGHARSIYRHFLLYALINEHMYKSMIKSYGNEFFKLYKVSNKLFDEKWGWHWVILREFSPP